MFRKAKAALAIIKQNENRVTTDNTVAVTPCEKTKTSSRYIELVQAILDCRRNGNYLIAGLCDRGTKALNEFVKEGECFISFLEKLEATYINDGLSSEGNKTDLNDLLNKNIQEINKGSLKTVYTGEKQDKNQKSPFTSANRKKAVKLYTSGGEDEIERNKDIIENQEVNICDINTWDVQTSGQVNSDELCRKHSEEKGMNNNSDGKHVVKQTDTCPEKESLPPQNKFNINPSIIYTEDQHETAKITIERKSVVGEMETETGCYTQEESEQDDTWDTIQSLLENIPAVQKSCISLTEQLHKHKTACISETRILSPVCRCECEPKTSKTELDMNRVQQDNYSELLHQISELTCRKDKLEEKLREMENINAKIKEQNSDLNQRLSEEMSAKVSADESNLENINILNRPVNIAEQYTNLCSQAWLDAKNALDVTFENYSEEMKLKFLCDILMISEKEASKLQKQFMKIAAFLINHPFGHDIKDAKCDSDNSTSELPCNLLNVLYDYERNQADVINIEYLVQMILNNILGDKKPLTYGNSTDDAFLTACNIKEIKSYIEQCARIAWKMVLQRPPMSLDNTTGVKQAWLCQYQEVYYNCANPCDPSSSVDFYVQPMLKHKDNMMAKGRVYINNK